MIKNPLVLSLYYLWIKALFVDIQRIAGNTKETHSFPGFVYWVYASQWFVYWAIHDMAYSSSQLASSYGGYSSQTVSLYFSNNYLFWLILDIISSILLFPSPMIKAGILLVTTSNLPFITKSL